MELRTQYVRGKGNDGMYIDRFPKIYAAGNRTLQPNLRVKDCFEEFMVQDAANASRKENMHLQILESSHSTGYRDMRNAGPFTESSQLINPPMMTKFQTLVADLKSTVYKSYWNKQVGKGADFTAKLPPNLDINNTTFGKITVANDNLYDFVMPNRCASPEKKLSSNCPGYQFTRNYCKDSFNSNMVYGVKTNADKSGKLVKCCLIEDRIFTGTSLKQPIVSAQRSFQERNRAELGTCLTPNRTIHLVSVGHVFGKAEPKDENNVVRCLSYCKHNPKRKLFHECLAHLNTLRKCLSKRFNVTFFRDLYFELRYLDSSLSGWLPKELIYRSCTTRFIRFTPTFIEPLLKMWKAINDIDIEYKTFVNIINFREPLPWLPKVWDISPECTDYSTTYKDMVSPQEPTKTYMAGVPSGRYFDRTDPVTPDGCCKADRSYLPQESDARACLSPSIFTLLGISHRDMYTERDSEIVKRVFKAAGEDMDDDMFNGIWKYAMKYHPKGFVCFETFRRAIKEYKSEFPFYT